MFGVEPHSLGEFGFVAAPGGFQSDGPSPALGEPFLQLKDVFRQPWDPDFGGDRTEGRMFAVVYAAGCFGKGDDVVEFNVSVDLKQQVRDDFGQLKTADLVAYPRLLSAYPAAADVKDLD